VGWSNVTNIDISTVVLHNMRSQEARQQTYIAMDMTRMPFRDSSFDIVIEKAGLALTFLISLLKYERLKQLAILNQYRYR
jgi:ubiquinone/menaquinone biosynthesis C-methylase UbiE